MEGGHVATFTDITQRKEAEDRLRYKAHHDTLTGLPNRSLFEDHLQLVLSQSRRYRRSFALLYIDLDYFKKVNDTMGHAAGDVLLVEAAQRMALCIRESDTLSRFGGDEFAALLSEIDNLEEVEEIARRIVSALDHPFELPQGIAQISGSVGIAIYPQHGTTIEELKNNADLALYSVKRSTRNDYRLYSSTLQPEEAQQSQYR
jgi:diguanylate cyclase (GGDEF)-like protein